ncbi:MAG: ribosomal L7Ae/L30e/S12e/Gadd45 family protein [Lachnospiraceae bacterium]|jgi:ribosomal protein L7Ae-like RNA K-turn-binding protein|nr:ribosomal L7Ae/L30e/S12e/Gadd45 family protein [Lachnospiraceae bacterium]MCI1397127.1 ribosomal L7Ae/L30e/S12e/Gadd45 family protein [Lachnospiraceae bacterium]MCI1422953.1 ribosomal L7Ae/L30e/S12e/Gadd45 family protein [Lachnospiraceae bacterium]MCI1451705.1 ribosomal L7Ae/L30e/S12e/Gadd45 family protein [Lachnospiraceae bacterium]MDD5850080.1 ribosomal L7Ae/L30e/S12e/Gadd45 family protein [Bacillota bacterium]
MQDKVLQLLGICQRAGKVRSGTFLCTQALKAGQVYLVLLAADAKGNTRHELEEGCRARGVPLVTYGDKESLGHAMGKELRSCAAVTDEGLARSLVREINSKQGERGQNVEENQ